MTILDRIRFAIPDSIRERVYVVAAALVALLASWGAIDQTQVPQWTALAVSVVTLMFAILHSASTVRTAFYAVLLALQGISQAYGILTESQTASILGFAAAVLGITVAASKTVGTDPLRH